MMRSIGPQLLDCDYVDCCATVDTLVRKEPDEDDEEDDDEKEEDDEDDGDSDGYSE
jgi:hypothetical protein